MKRRGFTLIELLVVISIISLLSSIVIASLQEARSKTRDIQRVQALIQIRNALELYHAQNGKYPDHNDFWGSLTPQDARHLTCFQCAIGVQTTNHYDQTALDDSIGVFLKPRPCDPSLPANNSFGGCATRLSSVGTNNIRGIFYKVNNENTEYKISTAEVIENINHVSPNLVDNKFNPGFSADRTISIYSSENSRYWTWNCIFIPNIGQPNCSRCAEDLLSNPNFFDSNCPVY